MFYKSEIKDHIRVPPSLFNLPREEAIIKQVKEEYENYISEQLGIVVDVSQIKEIREGTIIPGDGAAYYETIFEILAFKPELQEVVMGRIKDIADFGAFISIGPIDGMIHISQTMDDFVSFAKDKTLAGKSTKRVLKVGDKCKARIIAISFKDPTNPKLGLTMRQSGLGKLDWIEEDHAKPAEEKEEAKAGKEEAKGKKEEKKAKVKKSK